MEAERVARPALLAADSGLTTLSLLATRVPAMSASQARLVIVGAAAAGTSSLGCFLMTRSLGVARRLLAPEAVAVLPPSSDLAGLSWLCVRLGLVADLAPPSSLVVDIRLRHIAGSYLSQPLAWKGETGSYTPSASGYMEWPALAPRQRVPRCSQNYSLEEACSPTTA